jgi:hypothetical protein
VSLENPDADLDPASPPLDPWIDPDDSDLKKAGEDSGLMLEDGEIFSGATASRRRFLLFSRLLAGDSTAALPLGVDLNLHHLGLIAWGVRGADSARQLAALLARPLLIVPAPENSWWGWICGVRSLTDQEESLVESFSPAFGANLAVGLEAHGEAGFRATHRQAQRARWVARHTNRLYAFFPAVAVEALAALGEEDARAFISYELRGIDDDSHKSQQFRDTIAAYFAAGHNAASAAAALGIHQQTVANRLRLAERRLGHSVTSRQVELELALRLRTCLG